MSSPGAAPGGGPGDFPVLALAGNPNVGKTTLFNSLTGMRQHTGNWPGKTVGLAQGKCRGRDMMLVDLPGTYSLLSHSPEEQVARSFLCRGLAQQVLVVCDGGTLTRNLVLVLQILEITPHVTVCVNLLEEARRRGQSLDLELLSQRLGIPVYGVEARSRDSAQALMDAMEASTFQGQPTAIPYPPEVERALESIVALLPDGPLPRRFLALKLLEGEPELLQELSPYIPQSAKDAAQEAQKALEGTLGPGMLPDLFTAAALQAAQALTQGVVTQTLTPGTNRDRRIDRLLTSRLLGYPMMLLLLALVFWLTIVGTNSISDGLQWILNQGEAGLLWLFALVHAPQWLTGLLVLGAYRTTAWVCAVMLPPMAVFFPLFTLLEDVGYLPRVAFLLDKPFALCHGCGKQALSMCMGLGCNAAGVVGCRIIDSPRERLLAILTNSFMPCNGRFPLIITLLTLFFAHSMGSFSLALLLTGAILFAVAMTFAVTWLLSRTVLRGEPSAFALELPPYRMPQVGNVLLRSLLDRTVFVLGRALAVACPTGCLLWCLANCSIGNGNLLQWLSAALNPLGQCLGLDGVLLLSFLLGFPANEIVLPIALMTYQAQQVLTPLDLNALLPILLSQGWTARRAVCMLLFTLFHWPCSTTLLTVRKETGSPLWTALALLVPTAVGAVLCWVVHLL